MDQLQLRPAFLSLGLSVCFAFLLCFISHPKLGCNAQDSNQNEFLSAHNTERATLGEQPLQWDATVAAYAQNRAAYQRDHDNCQLNHASGPYGENLYWNSGPASPTDAVNAWISEKPNYDYNSNSCVGGECLHYTQVVWANSLRLGCALVACNGGSGTFVICNYDPPGNYQGQRPYP